MSAAQADAFPVGLVQRAAVPVRSDALQAPTLRLRDVGHHSPAARVKQARRDVSDAGIAQHRADEQPVPDTFTQHRPAARLHRAHSAVVCRPQRPLQAWRVSLCRTCRTSVSCASSTMILNSTRRKCACQSQGCVLATIFIRFHCAAAALTAMTRLLFIDLQVTKAKSL